MTRQRSSEPRARRSCSASTGLPWRRYSRRWLAGAGTPEVISEHTEEERTEKLARIAMRVLDVMYPSAGMGRQLATSTEPALAGAGSFLQEHADFDLERTVPARYYAEHPEVVKVLLAAGADVHARSATWTDVEAVPPHGYLPYNRAFPHGSDTALMFASLVGDVPSARLLVAGGANVNDTDAWGVSATTMAAHSNYEELVEFLLEKGANASADDAG